MKKTVCRIILIGMLFLSLIIPMNAMVFADGKTLDQIIGEAKKENPGLVIMKTEIGGSRVLQHPWAEAIPRVC